MKVKALLDPIGTWITPESLNVRGQKFEETVQNNIINGVFEIAHTKYDGHNAPPFPPDFSGRRTIEPYIGKYRGPENILTILVQNNSLPWIFLAEWCSN